MGADLKAEIAEWRKRSADLRAKLQARRNELARELADVDQQLKVIPQIEVPKAAARTAKAGVSIVEMLSPLVDQMHAMTLPGVIKNLIAAAPNRELPSKVIVEQVTKTRGVNATRVHSELFRMKERKQIGAKGERPNTIFYLPKEDAVSP